jgi:hypothetical protein
MEYSCNSIFYLPAMETRGFYLCQDIPGIHVQCEPMEGM